MLFGLSGVFGGLICRIMTYNKRKERVAARSFEFFSRAREKGFLLLWEV